MTFVCSHYSSQTFVSYHLWIREQKKEYENGNNPTKEKKIERRKMKLLQDGNEKNNFPRK